MGTTPTRSAWSSCSTVAG
uniref:Uncharacterized protein n=1 Tax=Arundo donax TaxID=35708 RepID=A0A0A8Y4M5_ARUDO